MRCIKGYAAIEPGFAVCGSDGEWIIEYPECEGTLCYKTHFKPIDVHYLNTVSIVSFDNYKLVTDHIILLAPVRLVDESGNTHIIFAGGVEDISRGRVELLIDSEWHTVCSQGFGLKEANVICNQLGLNGARRVRTGYYGEGSGQIVAIRNRGCDGGETSLLNCDLQTVSSTNSDCPHSEDVGIECLGMLLLCLH